MTTKYRPSTFTAVLELMLVLAVGLIVIGALRGWFVQAKSQRNGSLIDLTDKLPQSIQETSEMRRVVTTPPWSAADGAPTPFAAAPQSAGPGDAWTQNARAPGGEDRRN